jgi:RHS repeat-associated protein
VTTSYTFDGDGNRLTLATGGTVSTRYLWDTNDSLPELAVERDGGGNPLRDYIYAGTAALEMLNGGNAFYYHHDRLGSITAVSSTTGTPEWQYTYEPFGSSRTTTKVDPNAPTNPLGYVGQYQDPATGLLDLRARQYDEQSGRFLSTDPQPLGPTAPYEDPYDYAGQDPINAYDLDGMSWWSSTKHLAGQYAVNYGATFAGIGGGIVGFAVCGPGCALAGAAIAAGATQYAIDRSQHASTAHTIVDTAEAAVTGGLDRLGREPGSSDSGKPPSPSPTKTPASSKSVVVVRVVVIRVKVKYNHH